MYSFELSVEVRQDVGHAWEFYFNQLKAWWPKEFYTSERTKRFIIQTFIGGKVYEDFGEGDGLIWGDVVGVDYLKSLEIRGNLTKAFGGPVITFEKFTFEKTATGTRVSYSVDFVGEIKESSVNSLHAGWQDILLNHYKNYCDNRE